MGYLTIYWDKSNCCAMICDFNYGTAQKLFKDHDETKKHLFCYITAERNYLSRPV